MTPVRVLLADDQPLIRAGIRTVVDCAEDLTVVGEAADGAAAVELVGAQRPDVVLMDIRMPGTDGLAALRRITADPASAGVRVIMLTTFALGRVSHMGVRTAGRMSR
ncbi:response regulator [Pseudonocardia sp. HH130630-07]|uniref:response regulator n=1 Tax=Pseudonocardia sp. HH130630-07 TaxID=1690815 RepID=UPI0009F3D99C